MKKIITLVIVALLAVPVASAFGPRDVANFVKPSIVLVHGAWADGSGWNRVVQLLQVEGYTVYAPPNPLRGLSSDAVYLADFLDSLTGPIVLVGHSYGGAVITNAATGNSNVKALVFVDAFVPDRGEVLGQLATAPPPPGQSASCLADPTSDLNFVPLTTGDVDTYVKPSLFPSCFANDLPPNQSAVLASTQRPLALSTLTDPSGVPAWKTIPSWYLVGTIDQVIPSWAQLFMAQRAGATIVQVRAGHLSMLSHPTAVVGLVDQAVLSIQGTLNANAQPPVATAAA